MRFNIFHGRIIIHHWGGCKNLHTTWTPFENNLINFFYKCFNFIEVDLFEKKRSFTIMYQAMIKCQHIFMVEEEHSENSYFMVEERDRENSYL